MFLRELYKRLYRGFLLLGTAVAIGTVGYSILGRMAGRDFSLIDCLYMTVITISTVGFGEIIPVREVPYAQGFTIVLVLVGAATVLYFGSAVLALFVEEDLRHVWRQARMRKAVGRMQDHIIVCGIGATGSTVVREFVATKHPFVAVDSDAERLRRLVADLGEGEIPYVAGDATEDDVLIEAGVRAARGLVAALPTDKDNLYVTVSARQLNPKLRIVARGIEAGTDAKLRRAGANEVISPNAIGGMRMASVMVRPTVVQFLDLMLRDRDKNLRIEEVPIPDGSPLIGKALKDTPIRKVTDLLVIAAYRPGAKENYVYNPGPGFVIEKGAVIIVLGTVDDVIRLRSDIIEHRSAESLPGPQAPLPGSLSPG